jgi:hypothetical protein
VTTIRSRMAFTSSLCVATFILALQTSPAGADGLSCQGRKLFWDDRPIQLVGYSYYGLMGDRQFDAEAFLETLAAHNINYTRFFLILPWPVEPGPNVLPFVENRGKYDLRKMNEEFFKRLASVTEKAEQLGIICQVCLFDRCGLSVSDRLAWNNNPYNFQRNVNGLLNGPPRGYPPFCHAEGPIAEINAGFIKKVVETIGDRKNILYEIINEPYPQLGPLAKWHGWVARQLLEQLKGRQGSKVISSTGPYDDKAIDLFSMHSASRDRYVDGTIKRSLELYKPVILSDDGDAASMYNPAVTRMALERALKLGQHFEHLEFMIAQQREHDNRRASRLHEMPGLCLVNLRMMAQFSTPLLSRPYVRSATVRRQGEQVVLSAELNNTERLQKIFGQVSSNGGKSWSDTPAKRHGSTALVKEPHAGTMRNLVRIVCVDKQSRHWPGPAHSINGTARWQILLGDEFQEAGLIRVRPFWPDGTTERSVRKGQACYQTVPSRRGKYAYFRLDDTFPRDKTSLPLEISIRYFDDVKGSKLQLEYDGASDGYTPVEPVLLRGDGIWRTATFVVADAAFQGGQNDGADLRFTLVAPVAPLAIRSVSVALTESK